jgi:hypothetical protein
MCQKNESTDENGPTDCLDTSGVAAEHKAIVEDAVKQVTEQFKGYVQNVCKAAPQIRITSGGENCDINEITGDRTCRYGASRNNSIQLYSALFAVNRPSAVVYTLVHEMAHQIEFGGSPLYNEFVQTVYKSGEPTLLANYRFQASGGSREDFAETAAYFADTLLFGTGSPYNKYKEISPLHFKFASEKLF